MATRNWQKAMNELSSHGKDYSRERCERAMRSKEFDIIRDKIIIQTTSSEFKAVLKRGSSATNNYLRRLHNLALGKSWIHWQIIASK